MSARAALRRRVKRLLAWPPVGTVRLGSLRRLTPISRTFGFDRGLPIDRHYIERFLFEDAAARGLVGGRVLEFADDAYTRRFARLGSAVDQVDVLDVDPRNETATIIGDLTQPETLPAEGYDCVICTQVLPFVYDLDAAVRSLHGMLAPGGTLLVTVPGISKVWRKGDAAYGDYWRFTARSAERLFAGVFAPGDVRVVAYGNVLTAAGFLYGLATSELRPAELEHRDPDFDVIIGVIARRAGPA